ncbi:Lin0512 family protein [Roseobacter sp.]|uniref:Lin0512 family protein n=1 Tax=Roseobacter sp. TaxID=1907202 RepID=UPI0025E441D2|nr:Lin0512 family protein [Roseobacter sp.]
MSEQRLIIEMGMGNDLHGQNYTKAAKRAIEDAFRHSSLPLFGVLDLPHSEMRVQVTVGVQEPDAVNPDDLLPVLPRGRAEVRVVKGGLNVQTADRNDPIVVAQASVEAFLPRQTGWTLKS